ncbi:MAG: nucleotidyltransferase domain-containing protein [Candidatus Methanoperedens sp.]|nr:nucleotidyltransferase domain-containing protein [Candidatus Methanoperedens sp.]MCZ7394563.1 nucleotidyltransferase domain-containing protein [Candidatus Methanoperedens sp.]
MENITRVLEKDYEVLFAYLFGSYAKGIQDEKSDIDIAIYLKDENILEKDPLYPSRLAIKLEKALVEKKKVDVRVLNGSTLRFKSQVLRYGKLLHSKDEKKRIEFETSSLAQYYDFKPHLEMYDAARRARLGV